MRRAAVGSAPASRARARSHDYFRQAPSSSAATILADTLLAQLDDEPAVKEQPTL